VAGRAGSQFGVLLRQLREAAGLTQEELADAARMSPRSVSDLERGVSRTPRPETVRRLAAALGLRERELAGFRAVAAGRPAPADEAALAAAADPGLAAVRALPRDVAGFTGEPRSCRC
jgi:transcriptional regulator with XRE-family HTH domain